MKKFYSDKINTFRSTKIKSNYCNTTIGTLITDNFDDVQDLQKVKPTQQITKTSLLAKAKLFFMSLFRVKG